MPLKSGRSSKSIKKSGGQIMPSYFDSKSTKPVSYTHLTLPTIYSV